MSTLNCRGRSQAPLLGNYRLFSSAIERYSIQGLAASMNLTRTIALTTVALVAFASNSLLCRIALGGGMIDPASFTGIRLLSGALILAAVAWLSGLRHTNGVGSCLSGLLLFVYAVAFSFAYTQMSVATGALVLFAAVQASMMGVGFWNGERLRPLEWIGVVSAATGFVSLLLPGVTAPPLWGVALMSAAGAAWGLYSLRGRDSRSAISDTAGNFVWAVPFALATSIIHFNTMKFTTAGVSLAVTSGALASGVGYVIWYAALRGLSAMQASLVQLLVPVFAAAAGVIILTEPVTLRFLASAALILGGVAMGVAGHFSRDRQSNPKN